MYRVSEGGQLQLAGRPPHRGEGEIRPSSGSAPHIPAPSAAEALGWLLQGWAWILLAAVIGICAGVALTQLATPRFTAATDLMIAPSNLQMVGTDLYTQNLQSDSQILDVESRMRIITSSNVLNRVVAKLDLENDVEFAPKRPFIDVASLFGAHPVASAGHDASAVVATLAERIKTARQERSYVVTVSVWASEPDLSARIANAIAGAFRDEVAQGDAERAGRAAQSLSDRLGELKAGVAQSEADVERFRSAHGLQQGTAGKFINAQSMDQMNEKVNNARARLAEAEARHREVSQALTRSGVQAGAVQSPTLTTLLNDETAMDRQIASLSLVYGPHHPSLMSARVERVAVTQAIQKEIQRLRRASQLDVDQARQSLGTLQGEGALLRGTVSQDDRALVQLRELERGAEVRAALYRSVLTRAGEAAERQQIDATDVRVISPATPATRAIWPPRPVVAVAGGGGGGLILGALMVAGLGHLGARRRAMSETPA